MKQKQKGFISIQMALFIFLIAMFAYCLFKLVPPYVENIYVKDSMKFLVDTNDNIHEIDKSALQSQLYKYMTINSVGDVQAKSFKIHRTRDVTFVNSVYEVRVPLFLNIDAVMSFKNQLDSTKPEDCCDYIVDNWDEK